MHRSDRERADAAYPFTVENKFAKSYVKTVLDEMGPGEVRVLDVSDFRSAFVRVDRPIDHIWGPSRTFQEVFQDEYGDRLTWEIDYRDGNSVRVFHKHRRVPVTSRRRKPQSGLMASFFDLRNNEISDVRLEEEIYDRISIVDENGFHLCWEDEA